QSDVVHLGAAGEQTGGQCSFDRGGIGPEVMAGHDSDRNAALAHQRGEAKADGFEAWQVDLFGIEPARIVFAKASRFDEGQPFEFGSVGSEILARLGKHATPDRSPASHKQRAPPQFRCAPPRQTELFKMQASFIPTNNSCIAALDCLGAPWALSRTITGFFFFSSRRRHTRLVSDWSSDVCSSDLRPTSASGTRTQCRKRS